MAVVAGVVFFAVRALLALIPGLTVSFPIKKWSAAAALSIDQYAESALSNPDYFLNRPHGSGWSKKGDLP
jgi:hypothetical protein